MISHSDITTSCTAQTRLRQHRLVFSWSIEDYDKLLQRAVISPPLEHDQLKLWLKFTPPVANDDDAYNDYRSKSQSIASVKVFAQLAANRARQFDFEIKYKLSVIDKNGTKQAFCQQCYSHRSTHQSASRCGGCVKAKAWRTLPWSAGDKTYAYCEHYWNQAELTDTKYGLVKDNILTIHCEAKFTLQETTFLRVHQDTTARMGATVYSYENGNLGQSLWNGRTEHADVQFIVSGQSLPGNKIIIASQSPVFAAMFDSNMLEAVENKVVIDDISVAAFELMLKYLYTGRVEFEDGQLTEELIIVAEKYQIETLKRFCEEDLARKVDENTAERIGQLAELLGLTKLKEKVRIVSGK